MQKGRRPRTIASGWNGEMNVYDVRGMLDIERFRRIDIDAKGPEEVYEAGSQDAAESLGFLRQCLERLDVVRFVDPRSETCYGVVERGAWTRRATSPDAEVADILGRLGARGDAAAAEPFGLARERASTVGSLAPPPPAD